MAKRMRAIELEERAALRGRRLSQMGQAAVAAERMTELELQRDQLRARIDQLEAAARIGGARGRADRLDGQGVPIPPAEP